MAIVKVYRSARYAPELRSRLTVDIPRIDRFLQSSWLVPGARASVLSFDPNERIQTNEFDYLSSLFFDWSSFVHVYDDSGNLEIQSFNDDAADLELLLFDSQIVYLLYDALDAAPTMLEDLLALDRLNLCQRQVHADGSVMERHVIRDFACALFDASIPFQVEYDNGARLENLVYEFGGDHLDVQFWWSILPANRILSRYRSLTRRAARFSVRTILLESSRSPASALIYLPYSQENMQSSS